MKKALSLLLVLLLTAAPLTGLAGGVIPNLQETPTPQPSGPVFSFRGGIQWNMSREQVKALETLELIDKSQGSWNILIPLTPVPVSKFTAELVYMFYSDCLKMISYDFGTGCTEADYSYLTGALDSIYGDHTEASAYEIKGIMDQIYPGYYSEENLRNRLFWKAGEDTLIYLYYYSENAWALLYVNGSGTPTYVTTGL